MEEIKIDFTKGSGMVKPMHAVNNGPVGSARSGRSTVSYFKEAGIPYARNHDASFSTAYGGEYTVDVHRIFPDFDADEEECTSYDFQVTDQYVKNCFDAGTEVFYRLGAAIEHGKKKGTIPPKDFHKWAVICEHIIRHYTEGWANGFHYPFRMFGSLYRLGEFVKPDFKEKPLYCTAAKGEDGFALMLTHYKEEDTAPAESITLSFSGLRGKERIEYFLLDEKEDMTLVKTQRVSGENMTLTLEIPLYTTWFLSIT